MRLYSKSANAFFLPESEDAYRAAGRWPEDGIEIDDDECEEIYLSMASGKLLVAGENGRPTTVDLSISHQAADIRSTRDKLLTASDWTQIGDLPDTVKSAWGPYRQALRDIPAQKGFPTSVEWPSIIVK